jgi:bifunctional DNA-binding transcriptional regulator/antitoxin component of YhaV-PrlF toxin-antitoxin module
MPTVKLTAKRQATLPKEVCEQMHVQAGDEIQLEPRVIEGETVWIMRPRTVDWSWVGSVRAPAQSSHDLDDIRASIGKKWRKRGK